MTPKDIADKIGTIFVHAAELAAEHPEVINGVIQAIQAIAAAKGAGK